MKNDGKEKAICRGYTAHHGFRIYDWVCPNQNCGAKVKESTNFCPICGQPLDFILPDLKDDTLMIFGYISF